MADDAAAHGYDIFIDGIMRTHREQLATAEEAVRYFRRNSSNAHVGLFDRKDKVFLPVDGIEARGSFRVD
jgi:hypothetical protein